MPKRLSALLSGFCILLLSACNQTSASPPRNLVARAHAEEYFNFTDIPTLVASSEAVVEGTVSDVSPGNPTAPPSEGQMHYNNVTLTVDELHYVRGTLVLQPGDEVLFKEMTKESGQSVVVNGLQHSAEGDQGFYFLHLLGANPSTGLLQFNVINSQGRYLAEGSALVGADREPGQDALIDEVEALSPAQLRERITQAKERIESGSVQAQTPPIPCPPGGCGSEAIPHVRVEVGREGLAFSYNYFCVATAFDEVAQKVRIDYCRIEDRNLGRDADAPPAEMEGQVAATVGTVTKHPDGAVWEANTWICWSATATFANGDQNFREDCKQLQV